MIARLRDWLEHRTGYRKVIDALLIEHIPGGAKWRYVWGSCLAFVFSLQLVTGVLLMTSYSPGASTAWSSVWWIQYQVDFGWLIRGLHHFGSQTMVVLLGVHMLQVVIAGAHLPPREVNWWLGLGLMACVLGLSLTGYLLPWDQKGYWATQVATKIAGTLAPAIERLIVGDVAYGNQTLTRFYALHVGILPPLVIVLLIAHVAVFRRHGVTTPPNAEGEGWFWPDQAFRDMLVSMGVFALMLVLAVWAGHGHEIEWPGDAGGNSGGWWDALAHAGRSGHGVHLDAPADPSSDYSARPEWYFLFLYQLLKYFEGEYELVGTVVIPGAVGLVLFVLPLLGYGRMRRFGHVAGVVVVGCLLASIAGLTYLAIAADRADQEFQNRRQASELLAVRAVQLATGGVPADGAASLLRRDPMTHGKELFREHCATCHRLTPDFQNGARASDLAGWGTYERTRELLDDPGSEQFFKHTGLERMTGWVRKVRKEAQQPEALAKLEQDFDIVAQWLAGSPRGLPNPDDETSPFAKGYLVFEERCMECHTYQGEGGGFYSDVPDLTGYGSPEYLRAMMMAPSHPERYGGVNKMPAFRNIEGPGGEWTRKEFEEANPDTELVHLSDLDRELIIRYIRRDDRVVFGGEPISAPPQ